MPTPCHSPYSATLIARHALTVSLLGVALSLSACDGTEAGDGESYTLTGHVASVPDFDNGSVLADLPLGGGGAAAPNTSCSFGPGEPRVPVYLQEGSFSIEGDRFALRLMGGRWADGGEQTLDVGGLAVPGDGTVWELYPDGADQRYLAVFAPEGRGPSRLTVLIPRTGSSRTAPIDGCNALRFSGPAAGPAWGVTSETHPLTGVQSEFSTEINDLPLVIAGNRYGYTTLDGGDLALSEDGSYAITFETQTYPIDGSGSSTASSSSTGRYATSGSSVVFDYDLPSISVGVRTVDEGLSLIASNAAPRLPGQTLVFGR